MKPYKLYIFVLCLVVSLLLVVSHGLSIPIPSRGMENANLADSLSFWAGPSAFQATDEMRPALWWTVFAILLIDIGCVIAYLRYQRQVRWRQTGWQLTAADRQRLSKMLAALHTPEIITIQQYELREQPKAGFYLALK